MAAAFQTGRGQTSTRSQFGLVKHISEKFQKALPSTMHFHPCNQTKSGGCT